MPSLASIALLACSCALVARPALSQEPNPLVLEQVSASLRGGAELPVDRGVLQVPVVRADPEGGTIALEFHRFPGPDAPGDVPPIFFLNGGPGFRGVGPSLRREGFFEDNLGPLAALAEVVVVGQRGIGSSGPDTTCSAPAREPLDVLVTEAERAAALHAACVACREHWEAQGLALEGLTALEAAADVIAVADALGYSKITLVGTSFGSHWGMAVLRDHGARVARAVFSGLEGPDHTYDMPSHVLRALSAVAADAEASPELAELIPEGGLLRAFERVIARVEAEPLMVQVGRAKVLFDAYRVRELALGYTGRAGSRQGLRSWPADLIRLVRGDFDDAARATVREHYFPGLPTASFFMLDCGSGISAARHERLLADPATAIVGDLNAYYHAACPAWNADLGEEFRAGFVTDVPTVLVHGTWDTSTPFENALELEPCFTSHRLVVVERGSHGALGEALSHSPELRAALDRFLTSGELEGLPGLVELPVPDWVVPGD